MERLERIAVGLLKPINPYATLILGVMTFVWGLWIVSPFWTVFTQAALYSKADSFAPEWAWGTWSVVSGLVIILAVMSGAYHMLSRALGFITWHWFTFAGMFWWGDWQNTGGIVYTFIGLMSLYSYMNIKMNYVKNGVNTHF